MSAAPAPTAADIAAAEAMSQMMAASNSQAPAQPSESSELQAASSSATTDESRRGNRLFLAVRTSLLCEFRNGSGVLQAFEVCFGQTTFGVLCSALSRMPGVEFLNHDPQGWFRRPSRFTFRGELYEVGIPYDNICVCPVDTGKALIEMEEILEFVRHNVLRARASRYTVR